MIHPQLSLLNTNQSWNDLVMEEETRKQVEEIRNWLKQSSSGKPIGGRIKKGKPGYHALFYGAPGAGKALTAALIGKEFNKPVYTIDLSKVVSKYISETEKNLAKLFEEAAQKDWILFFDEADALFGKRTDVKDSHDRYANQEVSYLLQQIEEYPGLVILATNMKSNIDPAFSRRFHAVVSFQKP